MHARQRSFLLGIAGPSGSGKTTLAEMLAAQVPAVIFPADHYYRDLSHLPLAERERQNFDHPDAIESDLLTEHVEKLSQGFAVERPVYDFSQHTRKPNTAEIVRPADMIIVEGLFILYYPLLRELLNLKIFVEAKDEVCLERRLLRDMRERGRTANSIRQQFAETVQPMAAAFIHPSRAFADIVLSGSAPLSGSLMRIAQELARRK